MERQGEPLVRSYLFKNSGARLLSLSITRKQHLCDRIACEVARQKSARRVTSNIAAMPVVHATLCFDFLAYMIAVLDWLPYVLSGCLTIFPLPTSLGWCHVLFLDVEV